MGRTLVSRAADEARLIHDWNAPERSTPVPSRPVGLLDDTLRDGLQSTAVRQPTLEERVELLGAMARAGVHAVNLGMPAVSSSAFDVTLRLAREAAALGLGVVCAGRTLERDVRAIVELAERSGVVLEGHAFVGTSAIRAEVEGWELSWLRTRIETSLATLVRAGLPAVFVSEDTSRSHPATLRVLFGTALDAGATRLVICDTVGHATPEGVRRLLAFTRHFLNERGSAAKLDWHGHSDRGLSLANALAALDAGADRVHGTALGVGERSGNTPLELLLLNLSLSGRVSPDLVAVAEYARRAARILGVPIASSHPLLGEAAFRTATGVHASAIRKAAQKDPWLSDRVYGAVPAAAVGRAQELCVGPQSGRANVEHWLGTRGIPASEERVAAILAYARGSDHVLDDREISELLTERDVPWR